MELERIAPLVDVTGLRPDTTPTQVRELCELARQIEAAAVVVPPVYVRQAADLLWGSSVKPATVIGFPMGYDHLRDKCEQVLRALREGAQELDIVAPLYAVAARRWTHVETEIRELTAAACGRPVKWILETGLLAPEEYMRLAQIAQESGAAFVKTSTGIGQAGATVEAIHLLREVLGPDMGIKASGGIRTRDVALALIEAGANRIGTSSPLEVVFPHERL